MDQPIIFTSLTTSIGLAPIIAEKSIQAQFVIPIAISLAAGVLFASLITLFLVPALYLIQARLIDDQGNLSLREHGSGLSS